MIRYGSPLAVVVALLLSSCATSVAPSSRLQFPSLTDTRTMVDGYLVRPDGDAPRPAVVLLHGCGGLFSASTGRMSARETDWAQRLVRAGYVVLMVDSFSPRTITRMCSPQAFKLPVYLERPKDAYGALRYLQAQPFVRPDRIAVMGWSQGGGVLLNSVRADSLGRPAGLTHDFRAAVAFYPASCREGAHRLPWTSRIPTLVLVGEHDNWTPAGPCRALVTAATKRGSPIDIRVYAGAYHDFDWPDLPVTHLTADRTSSGVVPIIATDPAARDDALTRVPEFLAKYLD